MSHILHFLIATNGLSHGAFCILTIGALIMSGLDNKLSSERFEPLLLVK
jgi:hypothetical protein